MNSKQKHLLAIMLGLEAGILLFFFITTNPAFGAVLSAWIPGTQTPSVQTGETPAALPSAVPTDPQSSPTLTVPPPTTLPETIILGPTTDETLPLNALNPSLLAQSFPETFAQTPPIWSHSAAPAAEEIVLFRRCLLYTSRCV